MSIPSHYRQKNVNKNRRSKLKERLKNLIDKSDASNGNKVFLKQNIASLMQEYAELWECRNGNGESS
ncbi:hypothetical protein ACS6OG_02295 [Enterobacter hormaechei subsp. hoffmannii]|uniref:hypothetical protein n=1 Tax=Enterobacter cloacae complex TaxID=354276 RepID=UPI0018EB084E|nr:hypothetical protein [Enterobacter hormaechei]MBJ6531573.1 hypothetical protein [Enterobacter hormaechei]MDA4648305.1 hypothetical protein [Enterobacter hormaechei]